MIYPVIVIGSGGHAKVLIDCLRNRAIEILGLTDLDRAKTGLFIMGVPVIGDDHEILKYSSESIRLVNGIGSVRVNPIRKQIFERFKIAGYKFTNLVHPSVSIASDVNLSEGVQLMAGVVIQTGCDIGMNVIVNSNATLDHDCRIGHHSHISPGAVLSGGVSVGENSHIGTGVTIIQGIKIGNNCLISAGALVIHDVPDGVVVAGVPAREVQNKT